MMKTVPCNDLLPSAGKITYSIRSDQADNHKVLMGF